MISSKSQMSIVQGLGVGCSMMPLATWGEPGRGVKPSQVEAGAPPGAAVETAKIAAQHRRTDSILYLKKQQFPLDRSEGQDIALYMQLLLASRELLCCSAILSLG